MDIEKELSILDKYSLTPEELVFLAQEEENHPEYLAKYLNLNIKKESTRDVLISLQEKGVILKTYKIPNKGESFYPDDVLFNKLFLSTYIKNSGELGIELYNNYPLNIFVGGVRYSLRNISKKFNSFEEFCYAYGKAIKFDPNTHKEVMDILEQAKESNLINTGICEFVISMKWLELKDILDKGGISVKNTELI